MIQSERERKYIVAIDPGKTTGWSVGTGESMHIYGELDRIAFLTRLHALISKLKPKVHSAVIERFDSRSFTNDAVYTIKLIGAIEWMFDDNFIPYRYVNAGDKKRFQRHENVMKLKAEGLGHAADAEAIRLWDIQYGTW